MGSGELGPALLVIFEGPDAGGKGGALKRIVEPLDPRHYRVSTYAKPTPDEKRHHFLWRFYRDIPGLGGMALFDRSWYGRVLVERLEGFATPEQWMRAYDEILSFERTLVLEGMILVKFWMHLSDEEQLRRFQRRSSDLLKRWKLTDEDWRNRARNREYDAAAEEMFERTDHELRAVGHHRGRAEALRTDQGAGDPQRPHRAGHGPVGPPGAAPGGADRPPQRERPGHRLASPPP